MSRPRTGRTAGATETTGTGRRKSRNWLWLVLVALIAIALLIFLLARCNGDDQNAGNGAAPSNAMPPTSATSAPGTPSSGPAASGVPAGQLNAGGQEMFPLPQGGDLLGLVGKPVSGHAVPVQSVPGPEGFWIGDNTTDRVWIKLLPQGNSPVAVKPGQLLDFDGTVVANGDAFAAAEHVDAANGAEQLDRQKAHIELPHNQPAIVGTK